MHDVYIDTSADLKRLYPSLQPCTEPSKTSVHGENTYTLFNSVEDNLTIGWRAWRIAQATVAVVVGIFPGFFVLFAIPSYRHWIAEKWNEGYTGICIEKISIYVLPIVLEEFNIEAESENEEPKEEITVVDETKSQSSTQTPTKSEHTDSSIKGSDVETSSSQSTAESESEEHKAEEITLEVPTDQQPDKQTPTKGKQTDSTMKDSDVETSLSQSTTESESEELKAEITLEVPTDQQPDRQAPTKSKHTDSPMKGPYVETSRSQKTLKKAELETEEPKAEIILTDLTIPQSSTPLPTRKTHTDSPVKGPRVGLDYQKSHSSQRSLLNSNSTKLPSTRSTTKSNQAPVVESQESISSKMTNLAFNPPQGCTKEVQDKLMEISTDILTKNSFNVDAASQILALDLLVPNALNELEEYRQAL